MKTLKNKNFSNAIENEKRFQGMRSRKEIQYHIKGISEAVRTCKAKKPCKGCDLYYAGMLVALKWVLNNDSIFKRCTNK